ncbi:MAG: hypothetical protein BGN85_11420 [Alphaproteobacteria bacterium 64-11]|nr:class I SAM-dependent methyltransferase [Alphaproteobacteria bacterium]OJU08104.1 MAG: hypothetical protein BGN85_11420 [Alphaproteobacteria bacterium 64-11]
MLSSLKRFYKGWRWRLLTIKNALAIWSAQTLQVRNRLDLEMLECLSPIDRYVVYSGVLSNRALFDPSYAGWRLARLNKMLEIYGIDYFRGRKVLELGAGHGDIGAFLADLGADVLCLEGRIQNVNFARLKHRKVSGVRFERFNLEEDFSRFGRFDLIVHFGLLYHLRHVDDNLKCCFSMTDDVVMETAVLDATDPQRIVYCDERKDVEEEALDGTGSRPSPFYVERIAGESGFTVQRYFSPDLNSGDYFYYDWKHLNNERGAGSGDFRLRRFWRFQRAGRAN